MMVAMRKMHYIMAIIFISLCSVTAHGASFPDELTGTWQVEEVHLNTKSGRTTEYVCNDPRLKGRIFKITRSSVTDDTSDNADLCANPEVRYINTSFRDLMLRSVGGYDKPDFADANPVRDYKLNFNGEQQVQALSLTCSTGLWQGDLGLTNGVPGKAAVSGAWIVPDGNQKLFLRWRDESILLLGRISGSSEIRASFHCDKASTATEHAICGSYQLAAYDESVAASYKLAMTHARDLGAHQSTELNRSQRQWMQQRDACGADSQCILASMRSRLEALTTAAFSD
ncbi:lysozyme inhibitor LprI family protein [Paraburkholderia bannensis]|uniref:lysozyme inhibitor LprI family protein n=1 Tax=Paraburkholderia bannensis TaxID=765414 RepID=UPI002ABE8B19|nr:lysozyme inhibitor LprI family protein [Paraburkholderia bannensis]